MEIFRSRVPAKIDGFDLSNGHLPSHARTQGCRVLHQVDPTSLWHCPIRARVLISSPSALVIHFRRGHRPRVERRGRRVCGLAAPDGHRLEGGGDVSPQVAQGPTHRPILRLALQLAPAALLVCGALSQPESAPRLDVIPGAFADERTQPADWLQRARVQTLNEEMV